MSETHTQEAKKPKVLPKPNSDFYQTFQMLSEAEQAKVTKVREFMQTAVAPVINDFWAKDSFPFDVVPGIRELQIAGLGFEDYGCPGGSNLLGCYVAMEIAKVCSSRLGRDAAFGLNYQLEFPASHARMDRINLLENFRNP
jgi:glutaryl-CoA dehydrogenase